MCVTGGHNYHKILGERKTKFSCEHVCQSLKDTDLYANKCASTLLIWPGI